MIIYVLSLRHAQIAQLVEQWTENPRVTGSIPVLGTFFMPKNSQGLILGIKKEKDKP